MALALGTRLGPYEINAQIGVGGMGEVYRATDTNLKRAVAIKVLPDAFAFDSERLARFQREAEVLASLNHPNIAQVYGLEGVGGGKALVMELVEGPTLADRTGQGPIPLDEALPIARQIAEALEAAHERGIIHRDLKPANVKLRPDGNVKVLDFGLAKATDSQPPPDAHLTHSPTLSLMATQAGVILGTAAYMSPEQAKGLLADHRSDVFALGSVIYEMLAGRAAFEGESAPDILASVLAREPDYGALPPSLNARIPELIHRCLEKSPKRRWQAMGDLRAEIEFVAAAPRATVAVVGPQRALWQRSLPILGTAVLATAITSLVWWRSWPATPRPIARFPIVLPDGERFTNPFLPLVAISPDGMQVAYAANQRLHLRSISEANAKPIPGTEATTGFLGGPVFSPDGRSLAFWVGTSATSFTLKKIALSGGAAVTLCQASFPLGTSWDSTGIVFGQGLAKDHGIMRISPNGGKPELILRVQADELAQSPQVLPGGDAVLFTLANGFLGGASSMTAEMWERSRVIVHSLKGGESRTLIESGSDGRYLPTGHLVYALGGTMLAVSFDEHRFEVMGGPVPVVEGVSRPTAFGNGPGAAHFSVSNNGSLVYVPGPAGGVSGQTTLVVVDRKGGAEPLKLPPRPYAFPRVSPDGRAVAVGIEDSNSTNIWIYDLAGTSAIRQLTSGGKNRVPIWAGNEFVAFQSDRDGDFGIFWQRADGSAPAERLTKPEAGMVHVPESVSPDGKTLLYDVIKESAHTLWTWSLPDRQAARFGDVESDQAAISATFSPDGKWVAYASGGQDGTLQVVVQPFPRTGSRYVIGRGTHPVWSRDGKELSYENQGQSQIVTISTRPALTFGAPVSVPRSTRSRGSQERDRDSMTDGRFLGVLVGDSTSATQQINVVLNWFTELKQRVPVK